MIENLCFAARSHSMAKDTHENKNMGDHKQKKCSPICSLSQTIL
jgi:hypothetical protein